jgi:hypothetical protein
MSDLIALTGVLTALCLVLGIAGYLSDKWLERNKPLPPPQARAVVGQNHRPWM